MKKVALSDIFCLVRFALRPMLFWADLSIIGSQASQSIQKEQNKEVDSY